MQCSCGSYTNLHKVVRNKKEVGTFEQCTGCGSVLKSLELIEFLKSGRQFDKVESK